MDSRDNNKKDEEALMSSLPTSVIAKIATFLAPVELAQFSQVSRTFDVMASEGLRDVIRNSPDVFLARVAELEHDLRVPYMLAIQDVANEISLKEHTASKPNNHALYACYALMTDDIKSLEVDRLAQCVQYLQSRKFPQNIIDSVEPLLIYKQNGTQALCEMLTDPDYKKTKSDKYLNLSGAALMDGKFDNADLRGFNMRGADLSRASMYGANCRFANFSQATMVDTDVRSASLHEANLSVAKLGGAMLQDSYLSGANTTGATFNNKTLLIPEEFDADKLKNVLQLCQANKIHPGNILDQFIDNIRSNIELRGFGTTLQLLQVAHDHPYFASVVVKNDNLFRQNESDPRVKIHMEILQTKEKIHTLAHEPPTPGK